MFIYKRDGTKSPVILAEIQQRIEEVANYPTPLHNVDCALLAQEVITNLINGMTTQEIDIFTAERAAAKILVHLDYEMLAARVLVNNHHKNTLGTFSEKIKVLQGRVDTFGKVTPLFEDTFYQFIMTHAEELDSYIDYTRDYLYDYFGFCTLYYQLYLLRLNDKVVECPQDTIMRVAVFIHQDASEPTEALKNIKETYDMISYMYFTHASPTIFNSGLKRAGCISCFLAATDDSKEAIFRVTQECGFASAACGGIAFSASPWRSDGSRIDSSNGMSKGIVPFIKLTQQAVSSFNQGSRRKGSLAVYLHMHHPDLMAFLNLRKHGGDEEQRSRDTFIALWISDLFMERVVADDIWSFFDPKTHPQLIEVYGTEYKQLYEEAERRGEYKCQLRAREVWQEIYNIKLDSGIPYMMAADQINRANNHNHLGPIHTSNLCTEIVEYCENKDDNIDNTETACCTLASIALPKFVKDKSGTSDEYPLEPIFDYKELAHVVGIIVRNLNKVIDKSSYPSDGARRGSQYHRPIGIGVQGLADVFHKFKVAYTSRVASELNKRIFETIYYAAVSESTILARHLYKKLASTRLDVQEPLDTTAGAYSSYLQNGGCYLSKGIFNFQLYGLDEEDLLQNYDWNSLRAHIKKFGVRNSLMVAIMPTQSTAQMFRNTECCEPSINAGMRKVMGGEYYCINKYFFQDIQSSVGWTREFVEQLKKGRGSIQAIDEIPVDLRQRFRTTFETPQKKIIQLAAERQPFIDQSQSMNLFFSELTPRDFLRSHIYAWQSKLKTLSYYIRMEPTANPMIPTVKNGEENLEIEKDKIEPEESSCLVCGT